MDAVDHSSHEKFFDYYADASQNERALTRFRSLRDTILRLRSEAGLTNHRLEVADIGCGAGTQSIVWADLGHNVHGLDVNQPLLELAKQRAQAQNYKIDFQLGSSIAMPWAEGSMDVCVVLELLEHVKDWQACVAECARILRPNGMLLITTTNKLCPLQSEFNLPLYSWYPGRIKRYFERLAVTTRPALANYATYPAVNWFTFYGLREHLRDLGFSCKDRFDVRDLSHAGALGRLLLGAVRRNEAVRWLAQVASPGTIVFALKNAV